MVSQPWMEGKSIFQAYSKSYVEVVVTIVVVLHPPKRHLKASRLS
jgi:hypothetical protein